MPSTQSPKPVFLVVGVLLLFLCGCGSESAQHSTTSDSKPERSGLSQTPKQGNAASLGGDKHSAQSNAKAKAPANPTAGMHSGGSAEAKSESHKQDNSQRVKRALEQLIQGNGQTPQSPDSMSQGEIRNRLEEIISQGKETQQTPTPDDPSDQKAENGVQQILDQIVGNRP